MSDVIHRPRGTEDFQRGTIRVHPGNPLNPRSDNTFLRANSEHSILRDHVDSAASGHMRAKYTNRFDDSTYYGLASVPLSVANIAFWIGADKNIIFDESDVVTDWDARFPVEYEGTQAGTPDYLATGLGGRPTVDFGVAFDTFEYVVPVGQPEGFITGNQFTVFHVVSQASGDVTLDVPWAIRVGTDTPAQSIYFQMSSVAIRISIHGVNHNLHTAATNIEMFGDRIHVLRFDNTDLQGWFSGQAYAFSPGTIVTPHIPSGTIHIGSRVDDSQNFDDNLSEVLMYNRNLTDAEINKIANDMASRWNLSWANI